MIFQHLTTASQIKIAGLLLTDLSRAHVVRVLGVFEVTPAIERRPSWSEQPLPAADAIDRYRTGRLVGAQEAVGGEPHHPIVPSFVVLRSGEARLLEHQADAPDLAETPTTSFNALTERTHHFVVGPGVRVRLTYEDETPMRGAIVLVTETDDSTTRLRTCAQGWCIVRPRGERIRVRLLECEERYA